MKTSPKRATKRIDKLLIMLIVADWIAICSSLLFAQWLRFGSGLFGPVSGLTGPNIILLLAISLTWLLIFAGYGLYKERNMGDTPNIGDRAHGFELPDSTGKTRSLDEFLGNGAALLVFFRGVW